MGSEMLQVTGAGGLGEEASAAQQRGGILVTWSEEKKKKGSNYSQEGART